LCRHFNHSRSYTVTCPTQATGFTTPCPSPCDTPTFLIVIIFIIVIAIIFFIIDQILRLKKQVSTRQAIRIRKHADRRNQQGDAD